MKDYYGNEYIKYKGDVWVTPGKVGNAAIMKNGSFKVVFYGELTDENIEKEFEASGMSYALEEKRGGNIGGIPYITARGRENFRKAY